MTIKKLKNKTGFKTKDGFEFPVWMECCWKRELCNDKNCKLCGRILRDRQKHIDKGEDPDDFKSVFEDVGGSFKEVLIMIKKDAARMRIDITNVDNIQEPPESDEFFLYKKVNKWRKNVFEIADEAEKNGELWIYTEAAADLFWYTNTLTGKTYRQLCNCWHIESGDEYGYYDYEYTQYIIGECFKILKNSFSALAALNSEQKGELMVLFSGLSKFEKQIFKI